MDIANPTEKLELLAASASEIHAANERTKLRVEFKSDEDRVRKRQVRLLKNRQSAALSRQRKKEYINDLELRTNGLINENHELLQKISKLTAVNHEYKMHIDSVEKRLSDAKNENNELRARLASFAADGRSSHPSSTTNDVPMSDDLDAPRRSHHQSISLSSSPPPANS